MYVNQETMDYTFRCETQLNHREDARSLSSKLSGGLKIRDGMKKFTSLEVNLFLRFYRAVLAKSLASLFSSAIPKIAGS